MNNICGINVEASLRALWTPTVDLTEIWDEWSRLRYGKAGAFVAQALKKSREILLKGVTYKGLRLMSHGSILSHQWTPDRRNFKIFSQPGAPLLKKAYNNLQGDEFEIWQTNPKSVSMEEFRFAQEEALQAAVEGKKLIEKEERHLTNEDYAYFMDIYDNAETMLKAVRLVSEATYAMNLVVDNYDYHPDPVKLAQNNIRQLESYGQTILREKGNDFFCAPYFMKARLKDRVIVAPSLGEALLVIADGYRTRLSEWTNVNKH
jgi:hypothetical protein